MTAATVLIVEDEPITALDERKILEDLGFDVIGVAADGADALVRAERERPDIVLMDIMLKGEMDGIEAAHRLQTEIDAPVVFVTAYGEQQLVERALEAAPYGYLLKPFSREALWSAIEVALRKREHERGLTRALDGERLRVGALEREVDTLDHEWCDMVRLLWSKVVSNEELQRTLNDKSIYIHKVAHEMRTNLNAIAGFAQVMKHRVHGKLTERRYREYGELLADSTDDMLRLVDDMAELSDLAVEAGPREDREVDVARAITDAIDSMRARAEARGVTLRAELDPALPYLRGDPERIEQIFINLLDNAVSFTPDGGVVVVAAALSADGRLVARVSDNGVGVPKHEMDRILRDYGAAELTRGLMHRGRGLGLPLARELARQHDGSLTIDSVEGEGTRVTVAFPPTRLVPLEPTGA